jgi:uncharacterized protein with PhoU and TrkA domain
MTIRKLESLIAKREGKKKQVIIGNVREILRIIVDLQYEAMLWEDEDLSPLGLLQRRADSIYKREYKRKPKK